MRNTSNLFLSVLLFLTLPCFAATINVNWDGSGDYTTIQAAIDNAVDGETIVVASGTYYENINFNGENIVLTSTDPSNPAATIIDGNNAGRVVTFHGTEASSCLLTGFTITNGNTSFSGGGIRGYRASATITNCIITGNSATHYGGGLDLYDGAISNCIITGNSAKNGGGLSYCSGIITNCIVTGNLADDYGGGLLSYDGAISNCTIADNSAGVGGGIYIEGLDCDIINSIIYGNTALTSPQVLITYYAYDDGMCDPGVCLQYVYSDCSISYSDVEGGAASITVVAGNSLNIGAGNIGADPDFETGPLGDYYLSQIAAGQGTDSPCVDAGSDTAVNLGMDIYTTRTDKVWDTGTIDMGYHYDGNIADLDDSGEVDFVDFAILSLQWHDLPSVPSADIAPPGGDNFVDIQDLLVLIENWLWP